MSIKHILKKILPPVLIEVIRSVLKIAGESPRYLLYFPIFLSRSKGGLLFDKKAHVFFGYYDISPFNEENDLILATKTNIKLMSPHDKLESLLELGYYKEGKFSGIGKTHSWNWQQGCRYQWLDDAKNTVIYNDYRENDFCAVIYSVDQDKELRTLSTPIYSISKQQQTALSLDFSRLHYFRQGYGYNNKHIDAKKLNPCPKNDGIWTLDIKTGIKELTLDYEQIISYSPQNDFAGADHYLNHLCYSPKGESFLFFHLWQKQGGRRSCRLMVSSKDGTSLASYAEHIRASHYCWLSETKIILTGLNDENKLQYILIDLAKNSHKVISKKLLNEDGHPSPKPNNEIITDTYPDKYGFQRLLCVDYIHNQQKQLDRFYIPPQFRGELRCDLHPRLNYARDFVCVDMVYKNRRAMCILPTE